MERFPLQLGVVLVSIYDEYSIVFHHVYSTKHKWYRTYSYAHVLSYLFYIFYITFHHAYSIPTTSIVCVSVTLIYINVTDTHTIRNVIIVYFYITDRVHRIIMLCCHTSLPYIFIHPCYDIQIFALSHLYFPNTDQELSLCNYSVHCPLTII